MNISTRRLILRPLGSGDVQSAHEYASDPETAKYMMRLPNETVAETSEFLLSAEREWGKPVPEFYEFAVTLNGVHIGAVSLCLHESGTQAEIGWILNKKYHNRGYITEAAEACVEFARNKLKLKKIIAQCDYRNIASQRVMEKLGMTLVDSDGVRTYFKRDETARELTYELSLD